MKFLTPFLIFFALLWAPPLYAQEEGEEENEGEPLSITIRPEYSDRFEGEFPEGDPANRNRIEQLNGCPKDQILSCDITSKFWGEHDKITEVVAGYAYELEQAKWEKPDLGLVMGGRYAGLPDYLIKASFGIDPGIKPLDPFPQPNGQMYGSLWFADTTDIGDRMAGPVMLAKDSKNWITRYNQKRGLCIGVC